MGYNEAINYLVGFRYSIRSRESLGLVALFLIYNCFKEYCVMIYDVIHFSYGKLESQAACPL